MIYALLSLAVTALVSVLLPRHRALVWSQVAVALHALTVALVAPDGAQRAAMIGGAAVGAFAYLSIWAPRRRHAAWWILCAWFADRANDGVWVALVASVAAGAAGWATRILGRDQKRRLDITDLVGLSLLLSDAAGIAFALAGDARLRSLGRTQAVVVSAIQVIWLIARWRRSPS